METHLFAFSFAVIWIQPTNQPKSHNRLSSRANQLEGDNFLVLFGDAGVTFFFFFLKKEFLHYFNIIS